MSQKKNEWTRWHPRSPLFIPKSEQDIDYLIDLQNRAKSFHLRNTKVGDIVHQRERKIQVWIIKFKCPECELLFRSRKYLAFHIMREHLFSRKVSLKLARSAEEKRLSQTLENVEIYYEVIKPRKILSLPKKVEIDLIAPVKKGTLAPSPFEREKHDKEMKRWREAMQRDPREETLQRFPNGSFLDFGLSKNWGYFIPNVWREEAKEGKGAWLEPTEKECLNWSKLDLPKRVLYLLCIVKDEQ